MKKLTSAAVILAAAMASVGLAPAEASATGQRVDVALEWYDVTAATVGVAGAPTQSTNSRTWAVGWLAATRALVRTPAGQRDRADAALASAVHDALVSLVPARRVELDGALSTTLARIPDGPQRDRGVAAGAEQAAAVLSNRQSDGLDPASVNAPFDLPAPAPGVYRPTPPAFAPPVQAGNRKARPFLLSGADQFRPGPPPALDSERYRADLSEVRAYGALNSEVRTPAQTGTAQFWQQSSLSGYTQPLRVALAQSKEPLAWRALLVAVFHVTSVDTQIATSDAKYVYLLWRPVTAIRNAEASPDPQWTPLHVTPPHPDYPSGHTTYAGAAEQVLSTFAGPAADRPFTVTSPTAPGVSKTYQRWSELTADNVGARIWSGIHTRFADEEGVRLGQRVAMYGLSRFGVLLK